MRVRDLVVGIGYMGMLSFFGLPTTVTAQGQGASIVGQVQDTTGAVLPGVTVEVASPALIERTRSAMTDAAGRYAIVGLRPGTYAVTFSLSGFKTAQREGIVLQGAFSAQVNADLALGAVEETITVSGASPIVDVQNTRTQFVANRETLDALPSRSVEEVARLVPGVISYNNNPIQVGSDFVATRISVHGSDLMERHVFVDGMNVAQLLSANGGQATGSGPNELAQVELVYDVGSQTAETSDGGIQMNVIPKDGGNVFSGVWRAFGSTRALQSNNLTPELRKYLSTGNEFDFGWENNVATGGPIRQNKLWWFAALKLSQNNLLVADTYFADGRRADTRRHVGPNGTIRLTYQMTTRNKFAVSYYNAASLVERNDVGVAITANGGRVEPEAAYRLGVPQNYYVVAKWTSPVTDHLLLDIAQSYVRSGYFFGYQLGTGPFDVQHFEATTGERTVASASAPVKYSSQIYNTVANASYVTGSHVFKTGVNFQKGDDSNQVESRGDMTMLTFLNGVPNSVSVRNSPVTVHNNLNANVGLFAQDKWTVRRMTLTFGGRFDYLDAAVPAQTASAGRFVAAREAAAVPCVPCWKDWSIRFGAAYDLFGTGKTAVRVSAGKYPAAQALGLGASVNPMAVQTESRAWTDLDHNGSALDSNGNAQYAEIGPSRNANFGLPIGSTRLDPNIPWPTNWQESVSIQHEVWSGVSVTAGYYRRQFYNMLLTRNLLVDPVADYTPFTIRAPLNPNLPNGGGEVITMYNLNPNKLGAVSNVLTFSTVNTRVYNGFEVSFNARLPKGGFAMGGVTTGRTAMNNCDVANSNPNNLRFCNQVPPFVSIITISAGYRLPYGVQLSGSFLTGRADNSIAATYTFNSAAAGVPLTGGGNLSVNLVDPTTNYYDYEKSLDLRVSRRFAFGRRRAELFMDVFNVLNSSTVLLENEFFGPQWLIPGVIQQGRRAQIGARLDF